MLLKEKTQLIRKQLKDIGITNKQVSVKGKNALYDESITLVIKDLKIPFNTVSEIAEKLEVIRYDEYNGEILASCNTYVNVQFDYDAMKIEREKYLNYAKEIIEKYKDTPEGQLETIAVKEDMEVLYNPNWCRGNGFKIELCKLVPQEYKGEKYNSLDCIKRYEARCEYSFAEALVYIVNQYNFNIAV